MLAELENLFALQDKNYREFHARLMPNIEKERIIGIRVPVLRKYAKELAHGSRLFLSVQKEKRVCNTVKENDCDNVEKFLNTLPHYYYEENNLHMFLIMQMKDYDTALAYLEAFLPYILFTIIVFPFFFIRPAAFPVLQSDTGACLCSFCRTRWLL